MQKYIHIVKPTWIQHSINKEKQSNPRQYSPDPRLFLSGVVLSCGDIPEGDKEAIAGGCLAMGGLYSENISKLTTHLIALDVDDERAQIAILKNLKCKTILPHWFDDCLRLGKRISESPYLLPNPEVLQKQERPPAQRISPEVVGATTPHPVDRLPTPTPSSDGTRCVDIFNSKSVMLSDDLNVGKEIKKTLTEIVVGGGGQMVDLVDKCDIYICRYREGRDYVYASQNNKDVGNLSWLYWLVTNNRWTSPLRRLLHYPIPKDGVPGFQGQIISVSNYSGEARVYLENLVKACGAEFTKSMAQSGTHLITAHTKSEKCDAALEWNIAVVNHQWIEESYARYQMQSLSVKRYTHFPERINLGEVIGKTSLDRLVLEKHFFPKPKQSRKKAKEEADYEDEALQDLDDVPVSSRKGRRSNADAQLTPALRKFTDGKENVTPGARGAKNRALDKLHESAADIAQYEKERKRKGGVTHGRERRPSTEGVATPLQARLSAAATPASRGAKDKALKKLHENAADIAQYQKESKRKGGVTHGKDRKSFDADDAEEKGSRGKKRQSIEISDDNTEDDEEEEEVGDVINVKRRKSEQETTTYKLVLTSYPRWADNPKAEQNERNTLRNLGIHITEDTSKADILCAPKILRTPKFVCAIANAPYIVSSAFLDYCIKNKKVPDPEKYLLDDRESEDRHGFTLSDSLERAAANDHRLLETWQVFCTEQIKGGFDTFKQIVEANGGSCLRYQGRLQMPVKKRKGVESQEEIKEELYLLSGESPAERALWPKFKQMAAKADMVPVICKSDWLLNLAMSQMIDWDEKWALSDD